MDVIEEVKHYQYYMMGMNILSEIRLPSVECSSKDYDLKIIRSKIDIDTKEDNEYKTYFTMSDIEFICDIRKVAKFKITGGNLIQIDLYEQADLELAIVYLLGTCMGVLLVQRDMVALHGSTMVIHNQGVIITGQCGAGKSTLSTALRMKGYHILSDDISPVLIRENEKIMSAPAFPRQRICHDTAVKLGLDTNNLERACSEDLKYNIDVSDVFYSQPVGLFGIIQVVPGDVVDVELKELSGFEKLELIKNNIFCKEFYFQVDYRPFYYKNMLKLAQNIHTYRLMRPNGKFTVEKQIVLITEELMRVTCSSQDNNVAKDEIDA